MSTGRILTVVCLAAMLVAGSAALPCRAADSLQDALKAAEAKEDAKDSRAPARNTRRLWPRGSILYSGVSIWIGAKWPICLRIRSGSKTIWRRRRPNL